MDIWVLAQVFLVDGVEGWWSVSYHSLPFTAHMWYDEMGTWVNDYLQPKSPLPPRPIRLKSQLGNFVTTNLATAFPGFGFI